jgi:hypothetical protein
LPNWSDSWDSLNWTSSSGRLSRTPSWLKLQKSIGSVHIGRTVPTAVVPAPGSILLGSIGLLTVRFLRMRKVVV